MVRDALETPAKPTKLPWSFSDEPDTPDFDSDWPSGPVDQAWRRAWSAQLDSGNGGKFEVGRETILRKTLRQPKEALIVSAFSVEAAEKWALQRSKRTPDDLFRRIEPFRRCFPVIRRRVFDRASQPGTPLLPGYP